MVRRASEIPVVDDEANELLKRIEEQERRVKQCEERVAELKADLKEAKEEYEDAVYQLRKLAAHDDRPLFDKGVAADD
jgi:septal ring factor EnvC (AmiA/AmiB activator)